MVLCRDVHPALIPTAMRAAEPIKLHRWVPRGDAATSNMKWRLAICSVVYCYCGPSSEGCAAHLPKHKGQGKARFVSRHWSASSRPRLSIMSLRVICILHPGCMYGVGTRGQGVTKDVFCSSPPLHSVPVKGCTDHSWPHWRG